MPAQRDKAKILTPWEIYQWATQCPAWKGKYALMTAIAMAESGGNPEAENYCCVGLWQVNVLVHTQYTRESMKHPQANVQAACDIYKSQGLGAWESYTNGAYKKYTKQVEASLKKAGHEEKVSGTGTLGLGVGPDVGTEASEAVRKAAEKAFDWTDELGKVLKFLLSASGWVRIGKVLLGVSLLILAISELTKITPQVPTTPGPGGVAKAAKKVI